MKAFNIVFWSAVGGIVVCLAMTIITAVQQHRAESRPAAPISIPTPALPSH